MSNEFRPNNAVLHDHLLRQTRLVFEVGVTAHGTPASKTHISDLPGVAILRTEGKTSEADAIEDISSLVTAPDDGTGKFAVLINDLKVEKILKAAVSDIDGVTATVASSGITSEGRVYLDIDSAKDLSNFGVTGTLTILIELDIRY